MDNSDSTLSAARPWPGLREFTEADQGFFFGRDHEIRDLAGLVQRSPAALVYGESGLGKTSLLQAGVFPVLREMDLLPVSIRFDYDAKAPPPGEQLRSALLRAMKDARVSAPEFRSDESLWEYLHRRSTDLWSWGNRLLNPVFVIDQFEEAFTLGAATEDARRRAVEVVLELQQLIEQRIPPRIRRKFEERPELAADFELGRRNTKVVVAVRDDFFPLVDGLREQLPSLVVNRYRLDGMKRAQAIAAVVNPAKDLVTAEVASQIVEFVLGPVSGTRESVARPSSATVEPALLCLVCQQLNERRIEMGLNAIASELVRDSGGRIVDDFYEQVFTGIAPRARVWIETELLTPSGFRDRAALETAQRDQVLETDLNELVRRRLLHSQERDGIVWLELSHDLLTSPARRSRDLRNEQATSEAARRSEEQAIRALRVLFDDPGTSPLVAIESALASLPANAGSRALGVLLAAEICCGLGQFVRAASYLAMIEDVPTASTSGLRNYVLGLVAMETGPLKPAQAHFAQSIERSQREAERFDLDVMRSEVLSLVRLAEIARRQLDYVEAEGLLTKALKKLDEANAQIPRDDVDFWRIEARLEVFTCHFDQERLAEAAESLAQTRALLLPRLQGKDASRRWHKLEVLLLLDRGSMAADRDVFEARHHLACATDRSAVLAIVAEDHTATLLLVMGYSAAVVLRSSAVDRGQPATQTNTPSEFGSKRIDWEGEQRELLDLLAEAQHRLGGKQLDAPWTKATRFQAYGYLCRANVAEANGQKALARGNFAAGRDLLVTLSARVPDDISLQRQLAIHRGSAAWGESDRKLKLDEFRRAISELEQVPIAVRSSRRILNAEIFLHVSRSRVYAGDDMQSERLRALQDGENAAKELAEQLPAAHQEQLVEFWSDMAEAHAALGNLEQAATALAVALQVINRTLEEPLVQSNDLRKFRLRKASLESRCSGLWLAAGSPEGALASLQQATEACMAAWHASPYDADVEAQIAETAKQCDELLRHQREGKGAQPELKELKARLDASRSFLMYEYRAQGALRVAPVSQTFLAHPLIGGCWRTLSDGDLRATSASFGLRESESTRGRVLPLEFYGATLVEIEVNTALGIGAAARVVRGAAVSVVNGKSAWIHDLNEEICLRLPSPEMAAKYLSFFVSVIQGDEGRFEIIQHAGELRWADATPVKLRADVAISIRPLVVFAGEGGHWTASATTRFGDTLSYSIFRVKPSGEVEMAETQAFAGELPISVEYFFNDLRLTVPGEEMRMNARIAAYERRWGDAVEAWTKWLELRKAAVKDYEFCAIGEDELGELFHDLAHYQIANSDFEPAIAAVDRGLLELGPTLTTWHLRMYSWRLIALACLDRKDEAHAIWDERVAASPEPEMPSWVSVVRQRVDDLAELAQSHPALGWVRENLLKPS